MLNSSNNNGLIHWRYSNIIHLMINDISINRKLNPITGLPQLKHWFSLPTDYSC